MFESLMLLPPVRNLRFDFLKQNCVNGKSDPSAVASFFGPFIVDYAVAMWTFEDGFFFEVGLLDGSYLDVISLHPVYDA